MKKKVIHKRAVFECAFVCGWRPGPGPEGWAGKTETFWDRVTCKKCLKKKAKGTYNDIAEEV